MSTTTTTESPVRVHADHRSVKHLGHWTGASRFEVRARRGYALLDLRSPRIPAGDIDIELDLDHALVKLLVPEDAVIDRWDLRWSGRGKVKDGQGDTGAGGDIGSRAARRIRLTGHARGAEIRVHRGGVAVLSAMFSRAYLDDLRRAHREGGMPTVDDPTRDA